MIARLFRNRWWTVVASVLGLIVGQGSINVFAFSEFIKPVSGALDIGRGQFSSAAGLTSILSAVASPFFGRLLDKRGIRVVLLPSIVLFALATAALAFLQRSPVYLYGLFCVAGLLSVGQTPAAYSKAVAGWFDKRRGLALGIALAGVGLGTALVPQLAAFLIHNLGWRLAYVGLGASIFLLGFIPVALFLREPPVQAVTVQSGKHGLSTAEALKKSWRFWALCVAFFFGATAVNGTLTHIVALLTDRGFSVFAATTALSFSGLAIIGGRILSGYCLDKIFGPAVAFVFFLFPLLGILLLYSGAGGFIPIVATVLCGLGIGAEFDMMSFFVSRYFGLRSFGLLYGVMFGFSQLGNAAGSNAMGWSYQLLHSYAPAQLAFIVALAITCVLFLPLGPYPFPAVKGEEPHDADDARPSIGATPQPTVA